jgi:hypothetical protein
MLEVLLSKAKRATCRDRLYTLPGWKSSIKALADEGPGMEPEREAARFVRFAGRNFLRIFVTAHDVVAQHRIEPVHIPASLFPAPPPHGERQF